MTGTPREREERVIEKLADRYRDRGYAVQVAPILDGGLRSDLLATRPDETVLIEVRNVSREKAEPQRLEALAEHAARQGWRFSIVLVRGPETVEEVQLLGRDEVLGLLADARQLDASSWIAPIAATAAFEAAARFALARASHPGMARPSPLECVQALVSRGLITPVEEDVLRRLIEARNAAAHGMTRDPAPAELVTEALHIAGALVTPAAA